MSAAADETLRFWSIFGGGPTSAARRKGRMRDMRLSSVGGGRCQIRRAICVQFGFGVLYAIDATSVSCCALRANFWSGAIRPRLVRDRSRHRRVLHPVRTPQLARIRLQRGRLAAPASCSLRSPKRASYVIAAPLARGTAPNRSHFSFITFACSASQPLQIAALI